MNIVYLIILIIIFIYLREYFFWPWPLNIEDKYIKLVKELTKEIEEHKPAKEDSWKWKQHLTSLIHIHDLYLHFKERFRHQTLIKNIQSDYVTFIRTTQGMLNLRNGGWDTLEGEQLIQLQTNWKSNEIILEEIEKRFIGYNK